MRASRIAVLGALPALSWLGSVQGPAAALAHLSAAAAAVERTATTAPLALAQGSGTVALGSGGRIVTDGRPQQLPATASVSVVGPVRHVVSTPPAAGSTAPVRPAQAPAAAAPTPAPAPASNGPDAYPYATDQTGTSDPWGFTKRQCVSYVAWRLAEAGRPLSNTRDGWGSASNWAATARRLGDAVTTTPSVGSVAQWDANESGAYWSPGSASADGSFVAGPSGHVAWVVQVFGDGSVLVDQYNGDGSRTFSTMRVRAPRYLVL